MRKGHAAIACALLLSMVLLVSCGTDGGTEEVTVSNMNAVVCESNSEYGTLTFDFEGTDGQKYSCAVTGIGKAFDLGDDEQESIARNIGGHFAAGSSAEIEGTDEFDLIDAEKYGGKDNDSVENGKPYGDANLCWAASVSDMMVYAGRAGKDQSEDDLMSEFTEAYFDDGSFQETGIKYYLNGVNPDQVCAEKADKTTRRNAIFKDNEESDGNFFASTQVRNPGKKNGKTVNPGHGNEYAAEAVYEKLYASYTPGPEMGRRIISAVDNGDAVGMTLLFDNGESRVGVHALTIFGYIKDGKGDIKALIVADSDDDVNWSKKYGSSAEETLESRCSRPDTYDMYLTDSFEHNGVRYVALKDYSYSSPKMKYTDSVVQGITVLKSKAGAGKITEHGTCDAANTPDIALASARFSDLDVDLKTTVGKEIKLPFVVRNPSYVGYAASDKPVAKCTALIYRDGQKIKESEFSFDMVTAKYKTGEANCGFSVTNSYEFDEPGKYRIDIRIDSVCSGTDGHKLPEAFTSNNILKHAGTVTVRQK